MHMPTQISNSCTLVETLMGPGIASNSFFCNCHLLALKTWQYHILVSLGQV